MLSTISGLYFAGHTPVPFSTGGVPAIANLIVYYNTADPASFSTTSTTVTNLTLIPNNGTRTVANFNTVRPASITNDVITLTSNTAYVSDDVQTTISFWMKADSFSTQIDLVTITFSATDYLKVRLRTDGKIEVSVLNPGGAKLFMSAAPIALSQWSMITVSYRTQRDVNAYIAINGDISTNFIVNSWNVIPKNQTTRITANSSAGTSISRYMLWNTKLTAGQISDMYEVQRGYFDLAIPGPDNTIPSPVNMLVYYDMANTASYSTSAPTTVTSLTYYENTASMVGTYTFDNITPKNMKSLSNDYSNKLYLQNSATATVSNYRPTTIAFWLKTSGTQTESTSELVTVSINGSEDYFRISRGSNSFANNILFAMYKSGTISSSTNMLNTQINQSGVWQLITMIIQPTTNLSVTFKSYINGVLTHTAGSATNFINPGSATQNTSLGMITSSNASWSKYMMWEGALTDAQVTQLFNNQKAYYFGGFSGVLDYTGLNQPGIFLADFPVNDVTNYGAYGFNSGSSTALTTTPGTVNVTPPYMTLGAGGYIRGYLGSIYLGTSNYVHFNVWVNPIAAVNGSLFTFTANDVTISMSINSSYVFSGSVAKTSFTRNMVGTVVPQNQWTMLSISVILSNTQVCYLSKDGVALNDSGATGGGSTTTGMFIDAAMTNSTNMRFNQIMIVYDANFTPSSLYQLTKSSYGRV